jgi:hypothetical protein
MNLLPGSSPQRTCQSAQAAPSTASPTSEPPDPATFAAWMDFQMRALLTIVMCVLWATVGPAQTRVTVYLYCGLPAEGFVPEDFKVCLDAKADVRKALAGQRVTLVEAPEQARVTVEVLPAGKEAPGPFHSSQRMDRGNAETVHAVKGILGVNGYTTVLGGITDASIKRPAAVDLANQIDRWVKDNEAHLTNGTQR